MFEFPKSSRILKNLEFKTVLDSGLKFVFPEFVLLAVAGSSEKSRIGIIASRKVGNAVVRNKIKRRLREGFRRIAPELKTRPAMDFVVIARLGAQKAARGALVDILREGIQRAYTKAEKNNSKRRSA